MMATAPPTGSTSLTTTDGSNPFQVYPVRGLSDIRDLESTTVKTPEIIRVDAAAREFAEAFGPGEPPPKLLLAAKGDFGTGKTHLMLYARAVLASALAERRKRENRTEPRDYEPVAIMVVSSEAPIEEWYASELGPLLIEVAQPRDLVRELLTRVAIEVAERDPDPEVRKLAYEFRKSRGNLYRAFREPGMLDISTVDTRFSAEIASLCPRTSRSFRRAVEALRWEETAEFAEDWLAGHEIDPAAMERIGVRLEGDRAGRAANAICAIASLCHRLERPFCLYIDEFEHLTRFDRCNASKRNITWVKRLVESLARRGAMVFISGHWEAWDQEGDFLDRFVGGRPIQLLRLTVDDVMNVVQVRAGEKAWPGFTLDAARSVIEATSGNIRRIITVLYDLWTSSGGPTAVVTDEAVRLAAQRRLQPGSEIGIIPAIETAISAEGAELRRGERFGNAKTPVESSAWRENELWLMAHVVYARDELALISQSEDFARLVREVRHDHPRARGLVVTLGAVLEKHVLTLDAAFPETDLVNGEDPDTVQRLPVLVHRALAVVPPSMETPTPQALQALDQTRAAVLDQASAQIARSKEVLGTDPRSEAVRETLAPNPTEVAKANESMARDRIFVEIKEELNRGLRNEFAFALLRYPYPVLLIITGVVCIFVGLMYTSYERTVFQTAFEAWVEANNNKAGSAPPSTPQPTLPSEPRPSPPLLQMQLGLWAGTLIGTLAMFLGLWLGCRLYIDLREFRRFRRRVIDEIYEGSLPAVLMLERDNEMADALATLGPRQARLFFLEKRKQAS